MGKKQRKSQTSKNERNNVSRSIIKDIRREYMKNNIERLRNQLAAFKKGKNVVLNVPNLNTNETNKQIIRVNAKDVWKSNKPYMIKQNTSENV